jgi:hypothetical protein
MRCGKGTPDLILATSYSLVSMAITSRLFAYDLR